MSNDINAFIYINIITNHNNHFIMSSAIIASIYINIIRKRLIKVTTMPLCKLISFGITQNVDDTDVYSILALGVKRVLISYRDHEFRTGFPNCHRHKHW